MPKVSASYQQRQAARIVAAARQCFARRGFHATVMDDIITETGMSSSTVYRYFPDGKQALIIEVMRGWTEPLVAWLESLKDHPPSSVEDLFVQGIQHGWNLKDADGSESLVLDILSECAREPELHPSFSALYLKVRQAIEGVIQHLQRDGLVTSALPVGDIATLVHQTTLGITMERIMGGNPDITGAARTLAQLVAPQEASASP